MTDKMDLIQTRLMMIPQSLSAWFSARMRYLQFVYDDDTDDVIFVTSHKCASLVVLS